MVLEINGWGPWGLKCVEPKRRVTEKGENDDGGDGRVQCCFFLGRVNANH